MTQVVKTFHWADYLVFGLVLAISAAVGVYYRLTGEKQGTTKEFLLGGRKLPAIPVALSLQASFMSAIFVLGTPAEIYLHGLPYAWMLAGYCVSFPLVAHIFIPLIHKLPITSAYQYFEMRFDKWARLAGSMTFTLMMLLYMGVALYTPALAFSQVSGLSMWLTIVGIGLVCTFYTVLGGLKAVVWTDAFQMTLIYAGIITLLATGSSAVGGIDQVWQINQDGGRLHFEEFDIDPRVRHTIWTQSIGGGLMTLSLYAANQAMIQRYLSIEKTKDAQTAVYFAFASTSLSLILVILLGMVMYAYYHTCDPLTAELVSKSDQLVPLFTLDILGHLPGLPGLFTAAVFSAALSTVSSGVNSLAAVVLCDVIKPVYTWKTSTELTDTKATTISKLLAAIFGCFTVFMGYVASFMGPQVLQMALSIFGVVGGPLLGIFGLAIFFPCANSLGVIFGLISSLGLTFWLQLGSILYGEAPSNLDLRTDGCTVSNTTTESTSTISSVYTLTDAQQQTRTILDDVYATSYMWYSLIGPVVCITIGLIASILSGGCRRKGQVDSDLMYPYHKQCFCCCNGACLNFCGCSQGSEKFSLDDSHIAKLMSSNDTNVYVMNASYDADVTKHGHVAATPNGVANNSYQKYPEQAF